MNEDFTIVEDPRGAPYFRVAYPEANPKAVMGHRKVPMLSVIPPVALVALGEAMRYGAYESPRADGTHGYGLYNWREQPVSASTYVDAAVRHLLQWWDGEDDDAGSKICHLSHALASLAILIDATANGNCLDDRPMVRHAAASKALDSKTRKF